MSMAINTRSQGIVFVVCKNCGAILHEYRLGDPNNKSKFGGVPDPSKIALSKGGMCEVCGSTILSRPQDLLFLSMKKFKESFDVVTIRAKTGKRVKMLKVVEVASQTVAAATAGSMVQAPASQISTAPTTIETDTPIP